MNREDYNGFSSHAPQLQQNIHFLLVSSRNFLYNTSIGQLEITRSEADSSFGQ